jgi:uncharacterized protein YprB with RNaseH-like and TPR domain
MAKILFFDLETFGFNFNADAGFIMVASYKWQGEKKVRTITRKNPHKWTKNAQDDKEICRQFAKVIEDADMVVGWNSKSFDWRFLQTRMLKHGLGYLPPVPHEDGLKTARHALKMGRSLENIGKFFALDTQKEKMDLAKVWMPAGAGDPTALKQVIKRCESDVKLLEEAYNLLAPLSRVHPNVSIIDGVSDGCPLCKSKKLQQRGKIHALRHYRLRYQCTDCGRWSSSAPIKEAKKRG